MWPLYSLSGSVNGVTQSNPPYLQSVVVDHREAPHLDLLGQTLCFLFWFQSLQYLEKQRKSGLELVILQKKNFKNLKFIVNGDEYSICLTRRFSWWSIDYADYISQNLSVFPSFILKQLNRVYDKKNINSLSVTFIFPGSLYMALKENFKTQHIFTFPAQGRCDFKKVCSSFLVCSSILLF